MDNKEDKVWWFRRKYLINKAFQLPFLARLVLIQIGFLIPSYIISLVLFYRFNYLAQDLNLPLDHLFYEFLNKQIFYMSAAYFALTIFTIVVMSFYGLFLSHRIAGPLENIKKFFKKVEEAKMTGATVGLTLTENKKSFQRLGKLKFRSNDFFHELAMAYNDHMENLEKIQTKNDQNKNVENKIIDEIKKVA